MECSMKPIFVLVMLLLVLQLGLSVLVIVLVRFSLYSSDGETDGCLLVPPGAWNEACTYADVVASVSMLFTFLASILQLYFTRKELQRQHSSSSSNTPDKQICGVAPRTLQYCVLGLAACWWTAAAAALTGYGVAAEQAGVPQSTLRTVIIAACWASVGLFLLLLGVEVRLQRAAKQAPPPPPPSSISMSTSPAVTTQPRPMFYSYPAGSFHTNSYPIGSPGPPLGIFPSAAFSTASTMPGGMAVGIPIQPSLTAPAPAATAPSSSSATGTSSRGRATTDLVDPCSALGASRATAASLMRADSATGLGSTYSASLSSGPASQGLSGFSGFGPGSLYAPGSIGSGPVVLGTPVSAPAAAAGSTPAAAGAAAGVPVSAAAPGQPVAASPAADAALSAGPSSIGSYGVPYAAAVAPGYTAPGYVASLPRPPPRTTVRYATVTDADTPSSTGVYINGRDMASIEAMSSRGSTRSMPTRSDPPRAQRAPAAPKRAAKPAAVSTAATSTAALSAPASAPAAAADTAAASSSRSDRPAASSSRASKGHRSSSKPKTGRSARTPAAAASEDAAAPVQAGADAGPSAAAGRTPAAAAGGGGSSGRAQSGTSAVPAAGTAAGTSDAAAPASSKRSKDAAA